MYSREPLSFHGTIPIFSGSSQYTENYERISEDHLASFQKDSTNPFIAEDLWVELENSTIELVRKHSMPGFKILDVGVGLGRLLSHFPDLRRYGMDISMGYLEVAQAKGIEVCYAMAEDMPYKQNAFDLVVCTDCFEHVLDLNLCCAKILSVLRNQGILIARTPFREDLSPYLAPTYPYKFAHLRNFDQYSLRLLFERIFDCEFIEWTTAGYGIDSRRLKYHLPVGEHYMKYLLYWSYHRKAKWPRLNKFLFTKLLNPVEINVVVRKK